MSNQSKSQFISVLDRVDPSSGGYPRIISILDRVDPPRKLPRIVSVLDRI